MNIPMNVKLEGYQMICGSAKAESKIYKKIENDSITWYIPSNVLNPGDGLHCREKDGKHSEGYAGRTLEFTLEDGSVDKVQGPWASNADALFRTTGIDLRDKHLTSVIVAKGRKADFRNGDEYLDVMYYGVGMIGKWDRGEKIAQDYANHLKIPVYLYIRSDGGSSSRMVQPLK
jgi:hypothetical protein